MAVSDSTPNTANIAKGSGIAYFMATGETTYRDLGYCEMVSANPTVSSTDKMAARGGARRKILTFSDQQELEFDVTLMEITPSNLALKLAGTKVAAVSLSTTGTTATGSKTVSALGAVTNLVVGRRYSVAGTGIVAGTKGWYAGGSVLTLDTAATATGTGVALTITAPVAFGFGDIKQVTGAFKYVGDNSQGAKIEMEALNCIVTPNGNLELLNSGSDNTMELGLTVKVNEDIYGGLAQIYMLDF